MLPNVFSALPRVPSHYCRQSTSKSYLEGEIHSMTKLYDLLRSFCEENNLQLPSRPILITEFKEQNLGFYQPKKDQCDTCCSFKTQNISEEDYAKHVAKKNRARSEKEKDKVTAQKDKTVSAWTMDLQALLLCPRLQASALYYKTKLSVHNFTLYNLTTKKVLCYVWDESHGHVTANEFVSCIIDCLETVLSEDKNIKKIILYSDGCGYQNRNAILANALLDFAIRRKVEVIQKFLVRGHTQMEVDSAHSIIERGLKNKLINYPGDYIQVMENVRPAQPFIVKSLKYDFFNDFSSLGYYSSIRPGRKVGDPQVHDLRALHYLPTKTILYQVDFDVPLQELEHRERKAQLGQVKKLYTRQRKIKETKYKHLQELKVVIPAIFHSFYDDLPHY